MSDMVDKRFDDWRMHCVQQHDELNRMIREIHAALHGHGKEGIVERVARNSQRIEYVDQHVKALRVDVDTRLDKLASSMGNLNVRFWKMAIIVGAVVVALNKVIPDLGVIRSLGL